MIKPEKAKQLLEAWELPASKQDDWKPIDRYRPAIKKLPAKLRNIAFALLSEHPTQDDWSDWEARRDFISKQIGQADKLTSGERKKIFGVFFGPMASDVELAWQFGKNSPHEYTLFRSPKRPAATVSDHWDMGDSLIDIVKDRTKDSLSCEWLVTWVPYITHGWDSYEQVVGQLAAAVITKGPKKKADAVFDVLMKSATKDHEIGAMGRHVAIGLLGADREDGWELMEKMLLAAQRQEGLRQVLFSSVARCHPDAFVRCLHLIVKHKLSRFSSVIQAVNEWFGVQFKAGSNKKIHAQIEQVATFLTDAKAVKAALKDDDPEVINLALWALAFQDAASSLAPATKLAKHESEAIRFIAVRHLGRIDDPKSSNALITAIDDDDVRIAWQAVEGISESDHSPKLFEALERFLYRIPAKTTTTKPIVWPWLELSLRREHISGVLLNSLGKLPATKLIPHLKALHSWTRSQAIHLIANAKKWDKLTRETILSAVGDASADVRSSALQALSKVKLQGDEIETLEGYLSRTSVDLRTGVIELLLKLPNDAVLNSASRMLESKKKNIRSAGLELFRKLSEEDRERDQCIQTVGAWADQQRKITKEEQSQVDGILRSSEPKLSFFDALGLFDPADLAPKQPPTKQKVIANSSTTAKLLKSLDDLAHKHRKVEVNYYSYWSKEELSAPLSELDYHFPSVQNAKPIRAQLKKLPLRETWTDWYDSRPASLRDKDGFELLRMAVALSMNDYWSNGFTQLKKWVGKDKNRKRLGDFLGANFKMPKLRYEELVQELVEWLLAIYMPKGAGDYALDVIETAFATVPDTLHQQVAEAAAAKAKKQVESDDFDYDDDVPKNLDWRLLSAVSQWRDLPSVVAGYHGNGLTKQQKNRQWQLENWFEMPVEGMPPRRPDLRLLIDAYKEGEAGISDVTQSLLGDGWNATGSLETLTQRRVEKSFRPFAERKEIQTLLMNCRDRILEVELARGESATMVTPAAFAVDCYPGMSTLFRILRALGKEPFKKLRGWRANTSDSRQATFTSLVAKTYPAETDKPADFVKQYRLLAKEQFCDQEKLLQLAFLAPQWTPFIEETLKWNGFTEGIYWFMAHMATWGMDDALGDDDLEDEDDFVDVDDDDDEAPRPERLSRWERIIRERTDLNREARGEGAIDVNWFHRMFAELKPKRFHEMAAAAKFAASSQQAKRAQLIADVLVGRAKKSDIVAGIRKKKLKEYVRLIGLLPLPSGAKRSTDLMDRYELLQEYRRYANGLSSMSRPEALRSCEIGLQNLASTAGFADPLRLQWTLEAESTSDLAKGPVVVSKGDVSLTLELDEQAAPLMTIHRGEKQLKSLPKTVNKDKKFVELRERHKHLKRQASRVKASLQEAMCRGDEFTGGELATLSSHAILWPQLQRLVLVGEGIMGYPDKRGKALRDHSGKLEPVKKNERLSIAHPHDLLKSKSWRKWQKDCFVAERLQPFKQIFRELYVPTAQERKGSESTRYAGHQVNQRQAFALWGRRGWSVDEYGGAFKAFPDDDVSVTVEFNHGVTTPLEVEGLTVERISFRSRDDLKPLKLAKLDPRLFSEVMRDLDLVVSVAHVGEVDPEATESTVEMRVSLLRETCQLLGIKNVKFKDQKAQIAGKLGDYTVHLGSGVVHRQPGGSVCIVPVHSQHRGRLFLPFADDDPRTAEVISKTLLLARDEEIDDPIILEQLRAMA